MTRPTRPLKVTGRFTTAAARDEAWAKGIEGIALRRAKPDGEAAVASARDWEAIVRLTKRGPV